MEMDVLLSMESQNLYRPLYIGYKFSIRFNKKLYSNITTRICFRHNLDDE